MKKPTVAQLQAEIEALKHRIAALEARPHWPVVPPSQLQWPQHHGAEPRWVQPTFGSQPTFPVIFCAADGRMTAVNHGEGLG